METRCNFWLPKKNRFCANARLKDSLFCGNHNPRSQGQWIPCPIDPSHSILQENLEGHVKRCPLLKQAQSLSLQPFFQKGINAGDEGEQGEEQTTKIDETVSPDMPISASLINISSENKRVAVHRMSVAEFCKLIQKIESLHKLLSKDILDSYQMPEACDIWIKKEVDRKLPFQEKHVLQQASILGNLENFGVLESSVGWKQSECNEPTSNSDIPAVVEFGAGRGYLTQMLADCYGINRVFLVERKSYKLKADRSLRQKENLMLERLRIDIEDLDLNAVQSLWGVPFLAIGKHLCGPASDLTLRCCLPDHRKDANQKTEGLAIATCCHHLCQWKHYINKKYFSDMGIAKEEFHAITWFTSWAVDANHGSDVSDVDCKMQLHSIVKGKCIGNESGVEDIIKKMEAAERARIGFMCKRIIDMGRLKWLKEKGLDAQLIRYVPSSISPENHLLMAKC